MWRTLARVRLFHILCVFGSPSMLLHLLSYDLQSWSSLVRSVWVGPLLSWKSLRRKGGRLKKCSPASSVENSISASHLIPDTERKGACWWPVSVVFHLPPVNYLVTKFRWLIQVSAGEYSYIKCYGFVYLGRIQIALKLCDFWAIFYG